MNLRVVKILFYVSILCATLLSSCGGVTPIPQVDLTKTPTVFVPEKITPTATAKIETGIIEPENINQLQIIKKWGKGNVYGVVLSPDETELAVSTVTGVYIYDYETLQEKQFIDLPIALSPNQRNSPNKAISFSPDGNLLAIGYDDIIIWNLAENKIDRRLSNRIADYNTIQIAYSPKGDSIAVVSMGGYAPCDASGGNFALYSVESGNLLYNDFFCPESALFDFSFLNNGNIAFVGVTRDSNGWGYKVSMVNATTGVLVKKTSYEGRIFSISPDGSQIAISDSQSTKIIDVNTKSEVDNIDGIVIFLPDSHKRLVQSKSGWKITTRDNKEICSFENSPHLILDVYRSAFTIKGEKLIFSDYWYQNIEVWDLAHCKLIKQLFMPRGRDTLEYSNDGNILATSSLSDVHLFDGKNGEYKFSISGTYNASPSQYYDFDKNSKTVVTVSNVNPYTISFWSLSSEKEVASIPTDFEYIQYVSLSPDGEIVATIDYDGIHLWDVNNRSLLTTISGRYSNISWNPNSSDFALLDNNSIIFYNAQNGKIEKKISIPKERFGVVISKDWIYMAVFETIASKDVSNINEKIELWDMNGNKLTDLMEYAPFNPPGTSSIIYDLQFSPDNNLLVAFRYDYKNYSLRFWDTNTGVILRDVTLPFRISEMAFSPDGKRLTLLGDGIIYNIGVNTP